MISVILLAGGSGLRMGEEIPKQYLLLNGKPIARYSFDVFLAVPEITEITVVCDPSYRNVFTTESDKQIRFALPGTRRQDSVYNGLQSVSLEQKIICVHDAARPFIDAPLVSRVLEAGTQNGAATVGLPLKFTVKEATSDQFVKCTPDRSLLWEIQTPQVIRKDLLEAGFSYAIENNLTVTDDVSLVELINHPVKLIEGSPFNIKITVPADLVMANQFITNVT